MSPAPRADGSVAGPIRYFAYGRNLGSAVMELACPEHRYLGRAELPHHRLAFTRRSQRTGSGVADVLAAPGQSVWGALYQLAQSDLAALDQKEGNGWAYQRRTVRVLSEECIDCAPIDRTCSERVRHDKRVELTAFAYTVITPEDVELRPSPEYLCALLDGAHERELPAHYIAALAA
jgi:gamma-glutamylcyclotransferase (GGCT)/AIG2-like uncharacterized protein YtfP